MDVPTAAPPFELAAPPPPRPIQWRRARQLFGELIRDPSELDRVFELFDAMGGKGDEATVQGFAAHPEGRRLLCDKPALLPLLADRDGLRGLPEGSFGRAYLSFAEHNGFAADGLLEANARGLGDANERLDPDRRWFFERANLLHDLWHVLTGYGTDAGGESALLAFSIAQGLASRTLRLLAITSMAIGPKREGFGYQRFVCQAWRRGRRAAPLFVQPYEDLLPQPLEEVRATLRILPAAVAHPKGLYHADLRSRVFTRVAA